MKNLRTWWCVMLAIAPLLAQANLCEKNKITQRHRDEAVFMRSETFAPATPDYRGFDDYNAWVLACNRNRDNRGKEVEDQVSAKTGGNFANTLPMVSVKGQYSFYGNSVGANVFTSLEYRYGLRREAGEWIVTLPIQFNIPEVVAYNTDAKGQSLGKALSDRLDIPKRMAVALGLMTASGAGKLVCDPGQERKIAFIDHGKSSQMVDTGYYNPTDSYDGPACRLAPDRKVEGGVTLKSYYFDDWKGAIAAAWNRPGFRVEALVMDHDKISESLLKTINRDDLVWKLNMTFDASQRPRYRSAALSLPHIYVGAYPSTFVHEAGHELGLDDEYREDDKGGKNEWRDCNDPKIVPNGANYLMCWADYAGNPTSHGDLYWKSPYGIVKPETAKGIYAWIITRRYAVAEKAQCFADSDCAGSQYCDTGLASIGRNQCVAKKVENQGCDSDHQCTSPAICKGKPLGKCVTESSVGLGGSCSKDAQCSTGSCDNNGVCQCTADSHCGANAHCNKGALGVGRNVCVSDTVKFNLGANCQRNEQCASDSCSSKGHCQCKKDSQCASGQVCKEPALKENYCMKK